MKDKTKLIVSVIITFILTLSITVTASVLLNADSIAFTSDRTNKTNVGDSLEELYTLTSSSNNPWEGIDGEIYYLGTDKSYDIPALIENGTLPSILEYSKLTSDNFITLIDEFPNTSAGYQGASHKYVSGKIVNTPISKSYDSSSGVLNISGGTYQLHVCIADSFSYCSDKSSTATATIKTYLVIGPIK